MNETIKVLQEVIIEYVRECDDMELLDLIQKLLLSEM